MNIEMTFSNQVDKKYDNYEDYYLNLANIIFNYLNLNNIKLDLMSFNERALKCYTKCGFKEYGRRRNCNRTYDRVHLCRFRSSDLRK